MTTTLSADSTTATVEGIELRLNEQIEYKIPGRNEKSLGKIDKFMLADPKGLKSVWMLIINIASGETEWLSLKNWKDYVNAGQLIHVKNEGIKSQAAPDYPF